ncbi:MAG: glycosyltransferase family 4 protein [Aggregatilineales bacterium]
MRRILFCTDYLVAGGVERHLTELVTHLDRSLFDPHVLILYGERAGRAPNFGPRLQSAGVPYETLDLGWSPFDKVRGIIGIVRAAWRFRPDVLHALNYHSNLLTRFARLLLPPRIKLLGSMRGTYTPKQLLYERLSWRICARIVVNSPALQRLLVEQGHVPVRRVVYIPNGVDTARFAMTPAPTFREQLAPGARRVLVSIGRIAAEKQMHWLAQAIGMLKRKQRLPNGTHIFIVGSAQSPDSLHLLNQAIAADGLETIITHCPNTDQPELYYHAADATVLFSPAEGMPNVVLESLAAGRPVIISENANAAGLIEHGLTGWVVPTADVGALAETLHAVLNLTDAELAAFHEPCILRAQEFSLSGMVECYETLYESL